MSDNVEAKDLNGQQPEAEPDRMAQPVDVEQPPRLPFPVVGVGASAGGLEAFGEFLAAMRPDAGLAFVFILHLPPEYHSLLAEILGRRTTMPVRQAEDGMPVEPNHVYVLRPGRVLTIRDGRLHLGAPLGSPKAANRPVDDFFRSLAEEQREKAICVIMSGMGSNGTAGAQAVKAVGGLCVAQDPESAHYPSMPRHLIEAGYCDYIVRPTELPEVLLAYSGSPYATGGREADADAVLRQEQNHFREILAVLRTRARQDFSGYKKATIFRRVQRRMGLARAESLAKYARFMRQNPGEVTALANDLLIHVTGFFRDPEAWEALRTAVCAPLVNDREPGSAIRAWVAACSSGEEAYSLAMLLTEEFERAGKTLDVKVFATDLADRSLAHARAGLYPGGIESEISPERLDRFFVREGEMYRVRADLRDRVVFAPQNILQDPPFSRLDIATCRNMLIYLEPEVQKRVLTLLHFGLREGGTLFLGSSETVGGVDGMFETIDKKHRIFRRVGQPRHGSIDFPLPRRFDTGEAASPRTAVSPGRPRRYDEPPGSIAELSRQVLLDVHTPPAVTVDRDGQVVHFHGEVAPFLRMTGAPTHDLLLLSHEGVRGAVRMGLHRAAETTRTAITDGWMYGERGDRQRVSVTVSPVAETVEGRPPSHFVVSFIARGEAPDASPEKHQESEEEQGAEVRRLRAELQGTIEELQTSNEELKASHEEAMSVNEELQSANEELETGKEEMQSLNEELVTVNSQLRGKAEELQTANNDLASLLTSTDIAVLFLDTSFRIRRFTPAARDLVDLIPGDVGRPLAALARKFDDPHLDADARATLERLATFEREVPGADGHYYLRRVTPYRTTDNRIDGVVVTFVDITARRRAEASLRENEERLRLALAAARMGIWILNVATGAQMRDGNLNALLGLRAADTTQPFEEFLTHIHPDDRMAVRSAFAASTKEGRPLNVEFRVLRPDGSVRWLRDQGDVFGDAAGGAGLMAGACVDVTERREAEEALRGSEERLRLILESATDFAILTLDPERTVTSWSPGAEAIFGFASDEIVGSSADVIFTPEDRAAGAPEKEVQEARRSGRAVDERWHVRKNGSRFYASGVMRQLRDGGGLVKVARDLTDRKRMEDELRDAKDRLEERVAERTAELERAMDSLETEMIRRRDLARRLGSAQEDERRRVSRDLHDTVGQLLTGLSLAFKSIESSGNLPPATTEKLVEARAVMNDLGRELHGLAVRLRPTSLDDIGLVAAVKQLVSDWSSRSGVTANFQDVGIEGVRLDAEVETTIYRVAQEALTNVAKHADAKAVNVVLTKSNGFVSLAVEDDGIGFDPETAMVGRLGLVGMRERAELVGGTIDIESTPGSGTTVLVQIPIAIGQK
jgi:two-component system CheB/CheR fusion protein